MKKRLIIIIKNGEYRNMSGIFYLNIIFLLLFVTSYNACSDKKSTNMVPEEQINADKSTNYRYILREMIKKDKLREKKNNKKRI